MYQSRIVNHTKESPSKILANPHNHRLHPDNQSDAVGASLQELGFVKSVVVNKTTGRLLDGHLRLTKAMLAEQYDPSYKMDVEWVELTEKEELLALALLDRTTDLADIDTVKLDALIRELEYSSEEIDKLIAEFADENGLYQELPCEGDKDSPEEKPEPEQDTVIEIKSGNPIQAVVDGNVVSFIIPLKQVNEIVDMILKNNPDLEIENGRTAEEGK